MALFDSIISPALKSITDIISQFHLSPEDKAKAEQAIQDAQAKAEASARDYEVKLNDIAGQNIRTDAGSQDKFTSRARPMFMYIVEGVFVVNYIVIPFAKLFGSKVDPILLPGDLLTLFGVCVTGYVFSRAAENIVSLPGHSQVSVLGMTASNKPADCVVPPTK